MEMRKQGKQMLAVFLSLCMVLSMLPGMFLQNVKAEEGKMKLAVFVRVADENTNKVGGRVFYKIGEKTGWKEIVTNESVSGNTTKWMEEELTPGTQVYLSAVCEEGYRLDRACIGIRGEGTNLDDDERGLLLSESGYLYTMPDEITDYEFEIQFQKDDGNPNPPGGPASPGEEMSDDFSVRIGQNIVFQNDAEDEKITVADDAPYEVENANGAVIIKPKRGTDKTGDRDAPLDEKTTITLEPITVSGNGCVELHAGLNYTPEGVTDGSHVEEVVPVEVKCSDDGYAFFADGDVQLRVMGGNFRSVVTFFGGVMARGFSSSDIKQIMLGSADDPSEYGFIAPEGVNESQTYIEVSSNLSVYAQKAFTNYRSIKATDEAEVVVASLTGDEQCVFDRVDSLIVQTGGSFALSSNKKMTIPQKVQAGYFTQIGEILTIPSDGRMEDAVNIVDCERGDFSNQKGRYSYDVDENETALTLRSTTHALWSLGYSFRADSGDQYVENGHFEISAGSGLCREENEKGGEYWFEEGTQIRFKLVPDTGYRYKEGTFCFNGQNQEDVVRPLDEPGVYEFTMPYNPIHVSCVFEKADNQIDAQHSTKVKGADIVVPTGTIEGIAKFDVADKALSEQDKAEFSKAADLKVIGASLDLSMSEVVDKIGTNETWNTKVTELAKPMLVTLKLDDSLADNGEYTVVRQHDGKLETLDTTYDADTNSVTFETDKYSTYAIAYLQKKDIVNNPERPVLTKPIPERGTELKDSKTKAYYKVLSDNAKNPTVCYSKSTSSKATITIPSSVKINGVTYKVTQIADEAFKNNTKITKVTISKNVKTIGKYAFSGCKKLKTIIIGKDVTSIGNYAFRNCSSLTKVTLTEKTTKLGSSIFRGCTKLKSIVIKSKSLTKKSVAKTISSKAFTGVSSKVKITVPKGKTKAYRSLLRKKGLSKKVKVV